MLASCQVLSFGLAAVAGALHIYDPRPELCRDIGGQKRPGCPFWFFFSVGCLLGLLGCLLGLPGCPLHHLGAPCVSPGCPFAFRWLLTAPNGVLFLSSPFPTKRVWSENPSARPRCTPLTQALLHRPVRSMWPGVETSHVSPGRRWRAGTGQRGAYEAPRAASRGAPR